MARPKRKKNPVVMMRASERKNELKRLSTAAARMHTPITLLILQDKFGFGMTEVSQYLESYYDYLQKAIKDEQWLADITQTLEDEYNILLDFKELK